MEKLQQLDEIMTSLLGQDKKNEVIEILLEKAKNDPKGFVFAVSNIDMIL